MEQLVVHYACDGWRLHASSDDAQRQLAATKAAAEAAARSEHEVCEGMCQDGDRPLTLCLCVNKSSTSVACVAVSMALLLHLTTCANALRSCCWDKVIKCAVAGLCLGIMAAKWSHAWACTVCSCNARSEAAAAAWCYMPEPTPCCAPLDTPVARSSPQAITT